MFAYESDWSVTIYSSSRDEPNLISLQRILLGAKKMNITYGSVGVIELSGQKEEDKIQEPYVSLLHCDRTEANKLLRVIGVNPRSVRFISTKVCWGKTKEDKRIRAIVEAELARAAMH